MVAKEGRPRRGAFVLTAVTTGAMVFALVATPAAGKPPKPTPPPSATPKNVILFIGDGMGPEQVEIGRRVKGAPLFLDGIPWGAVG